MYKFFKGLLIVLLSLAVLCCGLVAAYAILDRTGSNWEPFVMLEQTIKEPEPYYYSGRAGTAAREQLEGTEVEVYDSLVKAIFSQKLSVSVDGVVTLEQLEKIYAAVKCDYPEAFWVDSYACRLRGGVLWKVLPTYTVELEERLVQQRQVEDAISVIVERAMVFEDDYDRALFVHDYLVEFIEYDHRLTGEYLQDIRSALLNGSTVCAGYAKAYSTVLNRLGIKNYYVAGTVDDKESRHAWNIVELEGVYTLVDVTFDDSINENVPLVHAYFCGSYTDGVERVNDDTLEFPATQAIDYCERMNLVYRGPQDIERFAVRLAANVNGGENGLEFRIPDAKVDEVWPILLRIVLRSNELAGDTGTLIERSVGVISLSEDGHLYYSVEPQTKD